jgi:uncharacterized membrane protein YeaQ/YmgE (transglycosylase-associated protein family)
MGILLWVVFGLIAGAIAKYLMPGNVPGGIVAPPKSTIGATSY